MTGRRLRPLAVPRGPAVLSLLPVLRAALSGDGPALLPHAAGSEPPATLHPGQQLTAAEDDPHDPTVAVLATSGSTGHPKGALLSASALLASVSATHDRLGGPGRWLLALPADHVAGLAVLLRSLVTGKNPVVLDLATGFRPDAFAAASAELPSGARRYTALVTTQLCRVLDAGGAAVDALASFDAVLVGGSAIPGPLLDRAAAAGVHVVVTYGMTETCGGCVYDGRPLDGGELALDDDGRVQLAGPVLARGYRGGDPDGAFWVNTSGQRWLRTDDAGQLADDGTLHLLGRLDDLIITGGVKISPTVVEAALLRVPGVAEAVVIGMPDAEWGHRVAAAIVTLPGAPPPTLEEVKRVISARIGAEAAPRQLLVLDALPLCGPGRPDLRQLAADLGKHDRPR